MAEKTILVCDVCGRDATERVTFMVSGQAYTKDTCKVHLKQLMHGAQARKLPRAVKAVAPPAEGTLTTHQAMAVLNMGRHEMVAYLKASGVEPIGGWRTGKGGRTYQFRGSDLQKLRDSAA